MLDETKGPAAKSKRGLGRGLGALFDMEEGRGEEKGQEVLQLDIHQLEPNRQQPRQDFDQEGLEELAASIRDQGIISPLIVSPGDRPDTYVIVAGERRWRAARMAGLTTLPALVRPLTEEALQRQALVDNVVRQDLNPMEEAEAFDRLIRDYGLTQEKLAAALGKSRPAVANSLRLLKLPQGVRDLVRQGQLTAGHARALLSLDDPASQSRMASEILAGQWTVRETEKQVSDLSKKKPAPKKKSGGVNAQADLHKRQVEDRLRRALGARVILEDRDGTGRIVIRYQSAEDRERLIDLLLDRGAD